MLLLPYFPDYRAHLNLRHTMCVCIHLEYPVKETWQSHTFKVQWFTQNKLPLVLLWSLSCLWFEWVTHWCASPQQKEDKVLTQQTSSGQTVVDLTCVSNLTAVHCCVSHSVCDSLVVTSLIISAEAWHPLTMCLVHMDRSLVVSARNRCVSMPSRVPVRVAKKSSVPEWGDPRSGPDWTRLD